MSCDGKEGDWFVKGGNEVGREVEVCHGVKSHIIPFERSLLRTG